MKRSNAHRHNVKHSPYFQYHHLTPTLFLPLRKTRNFFGPKRSPWFLLLKCNATSSPIAAKTNTITNGIQNHGRRGTGSHLTSTESPSLSSTSKRRLDKETQVNKEKENTPTNGGLASCLVANLRSLFFSNACCIPAIEASNLSPEEQRIPSTFDPSQPHISPKSCVYKTNDNSRINPGWVRLRSTKQPSNHHWNYSCHHAEDTPLNGTR